jgi:hypothetical protein
MIQSWLDVVVLLIILGFIISAAGMLAGVH